MFLSSEKTNEESTEPEIKKPSSRSIAGVLGKTLEDKSLYRAKELELREKELEVRKTEAENERQRIQLMENMLKQQNELIMTLIQQQHQPQASGSSNSFFTSLNSWEQ